LHGLLYPEVDFSLGLSVKVADTTGEGLQKMRT